MEFAKLSDETEIINLYKEVIESVSLTEVRLGWNIDIYPDATFINSAISKGEMCVIRDDRSKKSVLGGICKIKRKTGNKEKRRDKMVCANVYLTQVSEIRKLKV